MTAGGWDGSFPAGPPAPGPSPAGAGLPGAGLLGAGLLGAGLPGDGAPGGGPLGDGPPGGGAPGPKTAWGGRQPSLKVLANALMYEAAPDRSAGVENQNIPLPPPSRTTHRA